MNNLQYRDHAVDIHSHIIPGVDDGARTANEAADLITLDREEGMSVIFATPHYGIENGYAPEKSLVQSRFNELLMKKNIWQSPDPSSSLHIGTEWYCSDEIVQRILRKEAFPMGMSDWYMVEFLEWGDLTEPSDIFLYRLSKMKQAGINTILAHPEQTYGTIHPHQHSTKDAQGRRPGRPEALDKVRGDPVLAQLHPPAL